MQKNQLPSEFQIFLSFLRVYCEYDKINIVDIQQFHNENKSDDNTFLIFIKFMWMKSNMENEYPKR